MKRHRILLIANLTSKDAVDDAFMLQAYGYDPVTLLELHRPTYVHNQGNKATDQHVRKWVNLELMEGARVVLHPQHQMVERHVQDIKVLCEYLGVAMVHLKDLNVQADLMTDEHYDAANIAHVWTPKIPMVDAVVDPTFVDDMDLMEKQPHVARMHVVRSAPPRASAWQRFIRWSDTQLSGLKNPRAREQQELFAQERAYKLNTSPVSTTG